ncbi:MAG: PKD domain-containing protein [Flavobacteriales bacterium]|nr:PKD domain-containing protein [Flavobacteriales bacterium]
MPFKPSISSLSLTVVIGAGTITSAMGQVMIEVGTGNILNGAFAAPSPYANQQNGSRNQLLILASELQSAGMAQGTILGLGFDVFAASGTVFNSFSISIGNTPVAALSGTWETGLSPAWGPLDFADLNGWTYHAFDSPYFWDGVSNLVIETCYSNTTTSQNARVRQTTTPFISCVARNSPNPAICTDPGGQHQQFLQRPNVRFQWVPLETPPIAYIASNTLLSCTGEFMFTDASLYTPTSWEWNFGDDSTSAEQDPVHTYLNSGTYTVTLIATNAFGSDTAEVTVTVDLDGNQPVAACDAPSTGTVEGFGILNVSIEGIAHVSGDAVADGGYMDNTCGSITVLQGTDLDLSITTAAAASHAVRAWLDLDNSGIFTANELLLSASGPVGEFRYAHFSWCGVGHTAALTRYRRVRSGDAGSAGLRNHPIRTS